MKSNYKKQKDRAWKAFSLYIRIRDCLKTTGTKEWGNCCSCGARTNIKQAHAGHFLPGRRMSILFNEKNVHLQCCSCNTYLQGNGANYYRFMQNKYGEETIDFLLEENKKTIKLKEFELKEIEEKYKQKLKNLI